MIFMYVNTHYIGYTKTLNSANIDLHVYSCIVGFFKSMRQTVKTSVLGRFPFTSPRRQRRQQTRQLLLTLPKSPVGDVLSINGNTGYAAGDTGFAG